MIHLKDIVVDFHTKGQVIRAVDHVNLEIDHGDIFGIVGFSGAGKSTLVRTINFLQEPTSGDVYIDQVHINSLTNQELLNRRKKIGMIFQHFNLMNSRTILGNVTYPLKGSGLTKAEMEAKAMELLKLVGIEDKANQYPSQLSGGQKQRVGIARALANDPDILLCDEATSALDPQTTTSILHLLKELNQTMGLTIVMITHQMEVVKEICTKVAFMEKGAVIEKGSIIDIFANPKEKITQNFVNTSNRYEETIHRLAEHGGLNDLPENSSLVKLSYVGEVTTEPLIIEIFERFNVKTNILFGDIEYLDNVPFGNLVVLFEGKREDILAAETHLKDAGVGIEENVIESEGK